MILNPTGNPGSTERNNLCGLYAPSSSNATPGQGCQSLEPRLGHPGSPVGIEPGRFAIGRLGGRTLPAAQQEVAPGDEDAAVAGLQPLRFGQLAERLRFPTFLDGDLGE